VKGLADWGEPGLVKQVNVGWWRVRVWPRIFLVSVRVSPVRAGAEGVEHPVAVVEVESCGVGVVGGEVGCDEQLVGWWEAGDGLVVAAWASARK
jgi:hypothetical protein